MQCPQCGQSMGYKDHAVGVDPKTSAYRAVCDACALEPIPHAHSHVRSRSCEENVGIDLNRIKQDICARLDKIEGTLKELSHILK